mmetsp:Transcript_28872/g.73692  ORF Transcript_28872/g.73692 Transcript_28872/m.73692 type:complete len:84 (-) Transcript_28872:587-838(-)
MQEFNAAKEAVLRVFPDADIKAQGSDDYPITVTVTHLGTNAVLWRGDQRSLFRKNAPRRAQSQLEIAASCKSLAARLASGQAA